MTSLLQRASFATFIAITAGAAGAVEFQRQPTLAAEAPPMGVEDRYGMAVAADGDTVAIAVAARSRFLGDGGTVEIWVRRDNAWRRQAQIEGSGRFGHALSLQGDRLLIGAPGAPGSTHGGEAEVWHRIGEGWFLEGRLAGTGRQAGDAFGHAVALQDGRALVGAPGRDGPQGENQGAIHVFEFNGALWRERARIADPSARAGDLLGASVAWSGPLALGGAVGLDVQAQDGQGGVLAFAPAGESWTPVFTLLAADGERGDAFGIALAADARRVVVGAHLDDVGARADAGSARVFLREGERFVPEATLVDADSEFGALGYAVSLSGDAIALGGHGPLPTLFRRGAQGWQRAAAPEAASGDAVEAVAIAGDVLVAGAPRTDVGAGLDRGVAAISSFDGAAWTQRLLLTSEDGEPGPHTFGWDLAIDEGRALVGAPGLCAGFCPLTFNRGSAHFFERAGDGRLEYVGPAIGQPSRQGDGFAHAVALRGGRALVASGGGLDFDDRPALDVFERQADGRWVRAAQLFDDEGRPIAATDVAIDGDIAAAGNAFELHLFHRDAEGRWRHEAKFPAGLRGAYALSALALHGETVALGISSYSGEAPEQGLVYVLARRGGRWQLDARLVGDSLPHVGFGDQLSLHGDHLLVGESGAFGTRPGGGVLAYQRTARGWESRGRLALPTSVRWHGGVAVHDDLAFAHARDGDHSAVHAFEFQHGAWQPAGQVTAAGPRIAFDGETLLVSDFGLNLNTANGVEVFTIRR